jgi:hypothetical protein
MSSKYPIHRIDEPGATAIPLHRRMPSHQSIVVAHETRAVSCDTSMSLTSLRDVSVADFECVASTVSASTIPTVEKAADTDVSVAGLKLVCSVRLLVVEFVRVEDVRSSGSVGFIAISAVVAASSASRETLTGSAFGGWVCLSGVLNCNCLADTNEDRLDGLLVVSGLQILSALSSTHKALFTSSSETATSSPLKAASHDSVESRSLSVAVDFNSGKSVSSS